MMGNQIKRLYFEIDALRSQLAAAEARVEELETDFRSHLETIEKLIIELRQDLISIASMTIFDGGTKQSYGICYDHAVGCAERAVEKIDNYIKHGGNK